MISNNRRRGEEDHQDSIPLCCRGGRDDDDGYKRRRRGHKHLYVVLDDWNKGFSIYKIDTDSFLGDDEPEGRWQQLPLRHLEPPILRLEDPVGQGYNGFTSFSALGTKIFALMNRRCGLVYDTEMAAVAAGPHPPEQMDIGFGTCLIPIDDNTLYALWYHPIDKKYSLSAMSWGSTTPIAAVYPTEGWSWKQLPSLPSEFNSPPFANALHPDGHHILFTTTRNKSVGVVTMCTYSFDTKCSVWTWLGDWALPFRGQGHFDTELDAWVGICADGTVCACRSISPTTAAPTCAPLSWKATRERLGEDRTVSSKCRSASLTPTGGSNKFCLVERLSQDGEEKGPDASSSGGGWELRVTMFRLKYDHLGQLQTSCKKQRRSFFVSTYGGFQFQPVVFWM